MGKLTVLPCGLRPLTVKEYKDHMEGILNGPVPQGDVAWWVLFERIKHLTQRLIVEEGG